jgi:hypothetical protein
MARPDDRTKVQPLAPDVQHNRQTADADGAPTALVTGGKTPAGRQKGVVARLTVIAGPGTGATLFLYDGHNTLGRQPGENTVSVAFGDTTIGRIQHTSLLFEPGAVMAFRVLDNGHVNPIYVDRQLVRGEAVLRPGGTLVVGETTLRLDPL